MTTQTPQDFPSKTRGTYRVKGDETVSESEKLILIEAHLLSIATSAGVDIILHSQMQGGGWVLTWWPANEPQHSAGDKIIYAFERVVRLPMLAADTVKE